jgi:hypothetical protein
MFGSPTALWFSKDASYLAYVRFDDTDVDIFEFPTYGEPGDRDYVYPKLHPLPYPKVAFWSSKNDDFSRGSSIYLSTLPLYLSGWPEESEDGSEGYRSKQPFCRLSPHVSRH